MFVKYDKGGGVTQNMNDHKRVTLAELGVEKQVLSNVFDYVAVLSPSDLEKSSGKSDSWLSSENIGGVAFSNMQSSIRAVVQSAFDEKASKCVLETIGGNAVEIIARYMTVDGVPRVMELVRYLPTGHAAGEIVGEGRDDRRIKFFNKIYVDVMTNTYNRRYYEEKLKPYRSDAAVVMMDLDDFKVYNDVYGHEAGDAVLSAVAHVMRKTLRNTDKIVRYGGDEFLLIMPGMKPFALNGVLRNLMHKINKIAVEGYSAIAVSVSVGAVMCEGGKIEDAVRRADQMLYRAKRTSSKLVLGDNDEECKNENKPKVLIVDDAAINREVLAEILQNEYNIVQADGGASGMEIIKEYGTELSAVLLDLMMPVVNGFDVLRFMNENGYIEDIPVIVISGDESESSVRSAYEYGIADYINRPFDAKVVYKRVSNTINLYSKQRRLLSTVSEEILENEKNSRILVNIFSQLVQSHNGRGEVDGHVTNVNVLTELFLNTLVHKTDKYDLTNKDISLISTVASLHDIGKLRVDDALLNKPGKLTKEEFDEVKKHTIYGYEMIKNITEYEDEPLVKYALEICRWHHEKYDGKGYPDGLVGDQIPIAAQVASIADVYDALTSERPYKAAYSPKQAIKMILNNECGVFNPLLIECLKELEPKIVGSKK